MDIEIPAEYREYVRRVFPNLTEGLNFDYTSPVNYNYNCLSWALSCDTFPFENAKGAVWPWKNIPDDTADGWAKVLQIHGFEDTPNADFLPGFEKVAIFQDDGGGLHAARSDSAGRWKSKLGDMGPDIDHDDLDSLQSGYGTLVRFLRRRRLDWSLE